MAETQGTVYLSIGEVLGLLLEEFPDVTISKIRFLESQGLIAPERTPSGYRKFYEPDIELLKVILREQRENYLPLRVIKDRIDSGEIDPSGEMVKPDGEPDEPDDTPHHVERDGRDERGDRAETGGHDEPPPDRHDHDGGRIDVPAASIASHPASASRAFGHAPEPTAASAQPPADHTPVVPQLLPGVMLDRGELCGMTGITASELAELESYGIVAGRGSGNATLYNDDAVEIAKVAVDLMRFGVDARHLRGWRNAAEREASLFEQLIAPRLRQRNPEARAEALAQLRRLDDLGARLRTALMRTTLRHHFEG